MEVRMMAERKCPPGFPIYKDVRILSDFMSQESFYRVFKAGFDYFETLTDSPLMDDMSPAERKVYEKLKDDADRAWDNYTRVCDANRKRAARRWEQEDDDTLSY